MLQHIKQVGCTCETTLTTTLITTYSVTPQLVCLKKQNTGSQTGVSISSREHMVSLLTDLIVLNVKSKVNGPYMFHFFVQSTLQSCSSSDYMVRVSYTNKRDTCIIL